MQSGINYLVSEPYEEKRIREKFDDDRIRYGRSQKTKQLECWYVPSSSAPYKICTAENVWHAIRQMEHRSEYDNMRAKDMLSNIDAHNDKLRNREHQEAVEEFRSDLKQIASGKVMFMPPRRK